ncbi:serine hydrolase [Radicibacter daui]|uniref:serine hydrolase n=1 Tax=Radicibacter daui TaxID=3064829 RepID=UPI004046FB79
MALTLNRRSQRGVFVLVLSTILALTLSLSGPAEAAKKKPVTQPARDASIIIDYATGRVLAESNADEPRYPASLTKMMTLYLLFDALQHKQVSLSTPFKVSSHAAAQAPSKIGIAPGRTLTVEEAIHALTIKSANDIAVVVGENLGGSEPAFAQLMTQQARRMGMSRTTFANASGLPNSRQKTTARDLATLSRALIHDFPQFYHYFSDTEATVAGVRITTHNHLMLSYDGMDGLKTGFIGASGFNLASSAVRDGRRLVGVVMGGPTANIRDKQMAQLLDASWNKVGTSPSLPVTQMASAAPAAAVPLPVERAQSTIDETVARQAPAPQLRSFDVASADTSIVMPPPRPVGSFDAEVDDPYMIQIGAFGDRASGNSALDTAHRKVATLGAFEPKVVPGKLKSGKYIYRARFIGLNQAEALQACRQLKRVGNDCLVMKDDQG